MLTVGKKYEVEIVDLDFNGNGVAKIEEDVIFVTDALKNEKGLIEITKKGKNSYFGKMIKRTIDSPDRVSEKSNLGSLDLSHLSFERQLVWQKELTEGTLKRALKQDVKVLDTLTDNNPFNYRNKVVFHVLEDEFLQLGLYTTEPVKLVKVDNFILANKIVNEILTKINKAKIKVDPFKLKHVVFKNNSQNQLVVTLVSTNKNFLGKDELISLLETFKQVIGITINIKPNDKVILGHKSYEVSGTSELKEDELYITDKSFLQVNLPVMKMTYDVISKNITGKKIIDAYCGVGSIGFYLYKKNPNLTIDMIDNQVDNILLANKTKRENDYKSVNIIKDNSEDAVEGLSADTLVLDPPRQGLMPKLVDTILDKKFKEIIYLSCDLKTLTRDLRLLTSTYEIKTIQPIKMFPQTTSLETLVVLKLK